MKTISCPQCGSLIRDITLRQPIAGCDYCGAKIFVGEPISTPEPFDCEAAKFRSLERVVVPRTPPQPIFLAIAFIGAIFLIMLVVALLPVKSPRATPISPEPFKSIVFPTASPNLQKIYDDALSKIGDKEKEMENIQKQKNKLIKKRR